MSRLRVLHVYKDICPPIVGGVETHIRDVCLGLREEFDFAILVAHDRTRTIIDRLERLPVFKAATWGRLAKAPLCPTFPFWLATLARKADVIHYHLPNPTAEVSHLLMRPRAATVATYHSDIVRQQRALQYYAPALRAFLRRMDLILPTSQRYLESSPFLSPLRDRCRPVPLGIDTAAFAWTPAIDDAVVRLRQKIGLARSSGPGAGGDAPLIGFVGVLRAYKGLAFLIEAMTQVWPEAHCVIAGDGETRAELEALAAARKVAKRVHFLGAIHDGEKIALLHAIDVYCLPSHLRSEAFGLSQIEAMACGKPVVACNLNTGVPFVNLHGETGLIVPPASPGDLARAINELLASPELRRRLGESARRRVVKEFDRSLMLSRIASVYRELAGRRTAGRR